MRSSAMCAFVAIKNGKEKLRGYTKINQAQQAMQGEVEMEKR
jgi:hypothetical protein